MKLRVVSIDEMNDLLGRPKEVKSSVASAKLQPLNEIFSCQPESWDIPAHEYRYVTVYFNPSEIRSYRAAFFADVDDQGATNSTQGKKRTPIPGAGSRLYFELGGSGTMPCITVEEPTERGADGALTIDFARYQSYTHTHILFTHRHK